MKFKKILTSVLALSISGVLTACSSNTAATSSASQAPSSPPSSSEVTESVSSTSEVVTTNASNSLVVYFSLPETADPNSMTAEEENSAIVINSEVLGNTQYVAQLIAEDTGSEIFCIEAAEDYPLEHSVLIDQANAEQAANARLELKAMPENIDQYDTIFLGYPNWWGDMPMILYAFLENVDLSGKTIIPFNTYGGSSFLNTISIISDLQPNATVLQNGYSVSRNNMETAPEGVKEWLTELEV